MSDLPASARYECRICWQVYDPALGDPVGQISPGVAFSALPDDWLCPRCDAPKIQFILIDPAVHHA